MRVAALSPGVAALLPGVAAFLPRAVPFLLAMLLGTPADAMPQQVAGTFADLSRQQILRAGDTVWVAYFEEGEDSARDVRAEFLQLTDSSIRVVADRTELVLGDATVRRVAREQSGPLWNGALRGAVIGGGFVLIAFWGFPDDRAELFEFAALTAAGGAAIGMGIDALVKERRIVYLDPRLMEASPRIDVLPLISKERKGLLFSVRW